MPHPTRRALITAALTMPLAAAAAPLMPGWQEAVLIVPSLAPWIETLTTVGGWEVFARSAPETGLNALWRLPAGARTEQVVLRNIGTVTRTARPRGQARARFPNPRKTA